MCYNSIYGKTIVNYSQLCTGDNRRIKTCYLAFKEGDNQAHYYCYRNILDYWIICGYNRYPTC